MSMCPRTSSAVLIDMQQALAAAKLSVHGRVYVSVCLSIVCVYSSQQSPCIL